MASIWMLSKDAMRGMELIGTISDFLDELQTKGHATSESKDRVLEVLKRVIAGARSYIDTNVQIDSFSMKIAEAVSRDLEMTPRELVETIENCIELIQFQGELEEPCMYVLRVIAKNAMEVTSRRVDTKSLILH